jgi:hypothetical protein
MLAHVADCYRRAGWVFRFSWALSLQGSDGIRLEIDAPGVDRPHAGSVLSNVNPSDRNLRPGAAYPPVEQFDVQRPWRNWMLAVREN